MRLTVGPYNEVQPDITRYWTCGSPGNYLGLSKVVSFSCDGDAKGTALNIRMNWRKATLELCEVYIFGKGMTGNETVMLVTLR